MSISQTPNKKCEQARNTFSLEISFKDKPEYQELLHLSVWVDFQLHVSNFLLCGTTIKPLILSDESYKDVLKHSTQ